MSVDRLCDYFGFTRVPFGRDLAPSALFRSAAHSEAVARLTWLIEERGLGILTGEVGAGKPHRVPAGLATLVAGHRASRIAGLPACVFRRHDREAPTVAAPARLDSQPAWRRGFRPGSIGAMRPREPAANRATIPPSARRPEPRGPGCSPGPPRGLSGQIPPACGRRPASAR